jgi:hypothetical protein
VADPIDGHHDAELAAIARHALHDEELIIAFATGDLEDPGDHERARALIDRCPTCRDLSQDVSAIRAAIRASGTAAERAATMVAPRDFRLSAADAARLRPGSPIAGVARRLGWRARLDQAIAAFGRPVGAAMATFGVVGLLVGSLTLGGGPASLFRAQSGAGVPSEPGSELPGPVATSSAGDQTGFGPEATRQETKAQGQGRIAQDTGGQAVATAMVIVGSIALLVVGIALFVAARRRIATVPER